ncbi:MFS transporter [Nocardioides rubriscoriae]|uniref:MFS transporter n=1 Tax=Nocardioides rubriscoriae TaxID=642762 RepID=UPI0011E028F4|nr:MFS transporter [Nocardioides rubriscoriae]
MSSPARTPTPVGRLGQASPMAPGTSRPGLALLVITTVQLLMVLDVTIVSIALPTIQSDLGLSLAQVEWTVTGYALSFGGLLLLGGRLGDVLGRRRMLMVGIAVFAVASLVAGLAGAEEVLLGARITQGIGAAIASPTALALIPATFPEPAARARAMGVYAAMSGIGAATGLVVGGVLTEWVSWRWVFLLAVPFAVAILALAPRALPEPPTRRGSLPVASTILATTAVASLVYGVSRTPVVGWDDGGSLGWVVAAVLLAVVFAVVETRSTTPLLPREQLRIRDKQVAWASTLFLGAGMLSTLFLATQFMQLDLGFRPLQAGLGFIPFSAAMVVTSQVAARILARIGPWRLIGTGAALAAGAAAAMSALDAGQGYTSLMLPALAVEGVGFGLVFVPVTVTCIMGAAPQEAGVVSGLTSTMQQLGGAVGVAAIVSLSTSGSAATHHPDTGTGFAVVAGLLAVVAVAAGALLAVRERSRSLAG